MRSSHAASWPRSRRPTATCPKPCDGAGALSLPSRRTGVTWIAWPASCLGLGGLDAAGELITAISAIDPTLPALAKLVDLVGQRVAEVDNYRALHRHFCKEMASRQPKLLFAGDAMVSNWRRTGAAEWDARFAPIGAGNIGIAADTARDLLWRFENGACADIDPAVIVLAIGSNDLTIKPAAAVSVGIEAILSCVKYRLPGARAVLLGLPPRDAHPDRLLRERAADLNQELAKLAGRARATYLELPREVFAPPAMEPDGLNLSAEGYARLSALVLRELRDAPRQHGTAAPVRPVAEAVEPLTRDRAGERRARGRARVAPTAGPWHEAGGTGWPFWPGQMVADRSLHGLSRVPGRPFGDATMATNLAGRSWREHPRRRDRRSARRHRRRDRAGESCSVRRGVQPCRAGRSCPGAGEADGAGRGDRPLDARPDSAITCSSQRSVAGAPASVRRTGRGPSPRRCSNTARL